jgi:hypothetical protein
MNRQRAPTHTISSEKREFMNMAFDAFMSKTAKYSRSKTRFIARLLESDVDAQAIGRLNRALDASPQKTG